MWLRQAEALLICLFSDSCRLFSSKQTCDYDTLMAKARECAQPVVPALAIIAEVRLTLNGSEQNCPQFDSSNRLGLYEKSHKSMYLKTSEINQEKNIPDTADPKKQSQRLRLSVFSNRPKRCGYA